MKRLLMMLACFFLISISSVKAQDCSGVSVEVIAASQGGQYNYFGVRVTLAQPYGQDVTVTGTISDDGGGGNSQPFELTVTAGSTTAETGTNFFQTCPACDANVSVSSITPCPSNSLDLSHLRPTGSEVITTSNSLYTNFVSATGVFQNYPSLVVTDQNLDLVTLEDPAIKIIIIPVSGMGSINKLIAVCNTQISDYMFFFEDYSFSNNQITSQVYDESNSFIYQAEQTQIAYNISRIAPETCFGSCIQRQEDSFESTFAGWIYWNVLPHSIVVQTMAAINCNGCCKGWWRNGGC